jgi:hypothetical protein
MVMLWFLPWSNGWPIESMVAAHSAVLSLFSALMLFLSYRALPCGEVSLKAALSPLLPGVSVAADSAREIET